MARPTGAQRHDAYDSTVTQNPKVDAASTAPVSEKSSCVTPCCTMSPTTTSKIISNGAMSARVRRLSPRVRISRKTKMIVARTTISIRASSRHHPGVHVDAHHRHVGVEHGNAAARSEEHTSELQSLMRISYAVFCLNKK